MHKWEVGGGVGNRGEEGRVFDSKERTREMIDGLADAIRDGEGGEDVEAAIVLGGGGEVEATGAVSRPRFPMCRVSENRGRRRAGRESGWDGRRNQTEPLGLKMDFGSLELSTSRWSSRPHIVMKTSAAAHKDLVDIEKCKIRVCGDYRVSHGESTDSQNSAKLT